MSEKPRSTTAPLAAQINKIQDNFFVIQAFRCNFVFLWFSFFVLMKVFHFSKWFFKIVFSDMEIFKFFTSIDVE